MSRRTTSHMSRRRACRRANRRIHRTTGWHGHKSGTHRRDGSGTRAHGPTDRGTGRTSRLPGHNSRLPRDRRTLRTNRTRRLGSRSDRRHNPRQTARRPAQCMTPQPPALAMSAERNNPIRLRRTILASSVAEARPPVRECRHAAPSSRDMPAPNRWRFYRLLIVQISGGIEKIVRFVMSFVIATAGTILPRLRSLGFGLRAWQ